jgi:hypothetical protein
MIDLLTKLEHRRAELLNQFNTLGDFRPGSITATFGKCGKPSCRCAKDAEAKHGPNYRLTRKVAGKTVTETFSSPAALRKAQREVAEFHRFLDFCRELTAVSEQICHLRAARTDAATGAAQA